MFDAIQEFVETLLRGLAARVLAHWVRLAPAVVTCAVCRHVDALWQDLELDNASGYFAGSRGWYWRLPFFLVDMAYIVSKNHFLLEDLLLPLVRPQIRIKRHLLFEVAFRLAHFLLE